MKSNNIDDWLKLIALTRKFYYKEICEENCINFIWYSHREHRERERERDSSTLFTVCLQLGRDVERKSRCQRVVALGRNDRYKNILKCGCKDREEASARFSAPPLGPWNVCTNSLRFLFCHLLSFPFFIGTYPSNEFHSSIHEDEITFQDHERIPPRTNVIS